MGEDLIEAQREIAIHLRGFIDVVRNTGLVRGLELHQRSYDGRTFGSSYHAAIVSEAKRAVIVLAGVISGAAVLGDLVDPAAIVVAAWENRTTFRHVRVDDWRLARLDVLTTRCISVN